MASAGYLEKSEDQIVMDSRVDSNLSYQTAKDELSTGEKKEVYFLHLLG